jgi:hypothetical protein
MCHTAPVTCGIFYFTLRISKCLVMEVEMVLAPIKISIHEIR